MSYSDLRDFCPEVTYHIHGHSTSTLSLEKLGGGTPGHAYTGIWRFVITWRGIETFREQTLETRVPTTHLGQPAPPDTCTQSQPGGPTEVPEPMAADRPKGRQT